MKKYLSGMLFFSNIPGGDQLFVLMMSCIKGGDTRSPNVLFAEQMIKVKHEVWICKS